MSTGTGPAAENAGERSWRPSPAIQLSLLVHAAAVTALAVEPAYWLWALVAVAANHLLLIAAVFWPKGQVLGPNLVRLPAHAARRNEVCLTFDDGPDPEVTPRVLDLLDRRHAKASFFCVGEKAEAFPDIVREIARRGHSIENHSHRHSCAFAFYGMSRLKHEVESAQRVITGLTGRPPVYFRAPMGLRSPLLDPVLARCGLRYVSWTRRGWDTVHRDPATVLQRLGRDLMAGDVLLLHDSVQARTRNGEPVVLAVLPELLNLIGTKGLKCVSLPGASGSGSFA